MPGVINVKYGFGATGDGSTDDTAAINAAALVVKNAGGGILYFPAGVYIHSGGLVHAANMTILGESRASSIIKLKAGSNQDLVVSDGFATNVGTSNNGPGAQALKNITLDANRANQTALARCWAHYGQNPIVDDVWFLNGWGGGVYSEWGGSDSTQPMEGQWRDFKIWNYGGTPGSVGLDWNGPHDSLLHDGIIATLDSTIHQSDVAYGATPINGSSATFPTANTAFTFLTTAAAPTSLFPAGGGSFVVPIVGGTINTNWTLIVYTSAATVGSVTTFSGCTAQVSTNRSVVASSGIVQPTYGLRVNGGSHGHGESGLELSMLHIWGRNHFGILPNGVPVFASNCEVEGAFIVNVIQASKGCYKGGAIYGTSGQAGQVNEAGIQLGTDQQGCGSADIDTIIYNMGSASSTAGASVVTCSSIGGNDVRVKGTTSNVKFSSVYGGSQDRVVALCQNNQALSQIADYTGVYQLVNSNVYQARAQPTYSAAITPNPTSGPWQTITVTNATAFTINQPTGTTLSAGITTEMTIEVFNNSGGAMGAITWNGAFVFAGQTWTNPATGKRRFARFEYNGSNWICTAMSPADY